MNIFLPQKLVEKCSPADFTHPFNNAKFARFIDKVSIRIENERMRLETTLRSFLLGAMLVGTAALGGIIASIASAASPIYYCPDQKSDQLYSATKGPGCVPLIDKTDPEADERGSDRPVQDFKIEHLQRDVTAFLNKYRRFLDCCKNELAKLRQVEALGDEVSDLLTSTQANLSNYSLASRGIMLRELVPRVAKARADLKTLRARLEKIDEASTRRKSLDFEDAGRESQKIRDLEESIERDILAPKLPTNAKTGADIGVAPAAGPGIGRSPKTGAEIGREGLTGQQIGASPKSSRDIGGSGLSGFEIGATGRAGPSIGESPFNQDTSSSASSTIQRSTVGSSISESTVGSSLGLSTIGSDLQDTSVGSSFGGSSVGSSLQSR